MTLADMAVLKEAITRIELVRKNDKDNPTIRMWLRDAETIIRRCVVVALENRTGF